MRAYAMWEKKAARDWCCCRAKNAIAHRRFHTHTNTHTFGECVKMCAPHAFWPHNPCISLSAAPHHIHTNAQPSATITQDQYVHVGILFVFRGKTMCVCVCMRALQQNIRMRRGQKTVNSAQMVKMCSAKGDGSSACFAEVFKCVMMVYWYIIYPIQVARTQDVSIMIITLKWIVLAEFAFFINFST